MSYLLVPLQVSSSTASVWIGATGEPERELVLVATPGHTEVGLSGGWQHWEARPGGPCVDVQRATLEGLQARTRYVLELHGDNQVLASGSVTTLPDLYVADGAVMPGPVGANPCLTIAALADRFADGILARSRVG